MFAKLLKHEWRATAGTLGILSLAALAASILGGVLLYFMFSAGESLSELAYAGMSSITAFIIIALIVYAVAVEIILLSRYYKNKFTDEGYLTFTLPANSHQIFLSSMVNMLVWNLLMILVLIACVAIMATGMIQGGRALWSQLFEQFSYMFASADLNDVLAEFRDSIPWGSVIAQALSYLVFNVVIAMTCLTVGSIAAKKHKILASFGAYYVITLVINFLNGIADAILNDYIYSNAYLDEAAIDRYYLLAAMASIAVQLIVCLAGYFLSTYLMKRKLNLS